MDGEEGGQSRVDMLCMRNLAYGVLVSSSSYREREVYLAFSSVGNPGACSRCFSHFVHDTRIVITTATRRRLEFVLVAAGDDDVVDLENKTDE